MGTLENIFGHAKPSNKEVDKEFEKRKLKLDELNYSIVRDDELFHVHGHFSTRSDNPKTATKKFMIMCNELSI